LDGYLTAKGGSVNCSRVEGRFGECDGVGNFYTIDTSVPELAEVVIGESSVEYTVTQER
jgi:hypothetical protein